VDCHVRGRTLDQADALLGLCEPFLVAAQFVIAPGNHGMDIADLDQIADMGEDLQALLLDLRDPGVEPARDTEAAGGVKRAGCQVVHPESERYLSGLQPDPFAVQGLLLAHRRVGERERPRGADALEPDPLLAVALRKVRAALARDASVDALEQVDLVVSPDERCPKSRHRLVRGASSSRRERRTRGPASP
jgi:hypothetical protein